METQLTRNTSNDYSEHVTLNSSPNPSAVSWGAIFAGAVAAAALSLILLLLGTGLGLTTVSPWANKGISGTTFSVTTIAWVTFTSLIASAVGGYIAGRLRTRWLATQADEVYFRDTAHGFLAWGLATLVTATLLTSVISTIVGAGAKAGETILGGAALGSAAVASAAAVPTTSAPTTSVPVTAATNVTADNKISKTEADDKPLLYFLDTLFRKNIAAPAANPNANALSTAPTAAPIEITPNTPHVDTTASKTEVARIYLNGISAGALPVEDIKYTGSLVAQATGLTQTEAENRVADSFKALQIKLHETTVAARAAADTARKASAYGSLWLFISLLSGAFIASWTAIYGGRQRDL